MKGYLVIAAFILLGYVGIFLAGPWVVEWYESYQDHVYCQTHEPFVQHSWNTNEHHCPVDRERSTA